MYYKVKKGFDENDYYSIEEADLNRALTAQITGQVFICNEGSVNGNNIISIEPDWCRVLGFRRGYKLTGEDYALISKAKLEKSRQLISFLKTNVDRKLKGLPPLQQNGLLLSGSKTLADKFNAHE